MAALSLLLKVISNSGLRSWCIQKTLILRHMRTHLLARMGALQMNYRAGEMIFRESKKVCPLNLVREVVETGSTLTEEIRA